MTTIIRYNGSKFAGEPADGIDRLIDLLEREPLNPKFEHYGFFLEPIRQPCEWSKLSGDGVFFAGNFLNYSHAFAIESDEPDVIDRIASAIAKNVKSDAYRLARTEVLAACNCRVCRPEPMRKFAGR